MSFIAPTRRLAAGALAGVAIAGTTPTRARTPAFFRIGTGGTAGTRHPAGGLIADINAINGGPSESDSGTPVDARVVPGACGPSETDARAEYPMPIRR